MFGMKNALYKFQLLLLLSRSVDSIFDDALGS